MHDLRLCDRCFCAWQDRLETLGHVRDAGISVCAGGIIGLGEGEKDRVGLLHQVLTVPAPVVNPCLPRLGAVCHCRASRRVSCIIAR